MCAASAVTETTFQSKDRSVTLLNYFLNIEKNERILHNCSKDHLCHAYDLLASVGNILLNETLYGLKLTSNLKSTF